MGGKRRMERRVWGPMEFARCGRGRTGTPAPVAGGAGVGTGMPVSFCTMSLNSPGSVSIVFVGVRRDARGRRLPAGRDGGCRGDGSLIVAVDCGNDVRQFCSVSTSDREVLLEMFC